MSKSADRQKKKKNIYFYIETYIKKYKSKSNKYNHALKNELKITL